MARHNPFGSLMAEKRPKSILSGLKNMLHRDSEKPSAPAPKPSTAARKKATSTEKRAATARAAKEQSPAAPGAEPPAASEPAAETKPEKSKVQNQPWYRHRQRW
jgi:hypothetical protein